MTKGRNFNQGKRGFTIVELLIVVVAIAILAAITIVSYTGITQRAKTTRSISTADQVRTKAAVWNSLLNTYPDLAQIRTNSISPADIDTAGGAAGPVEAKLSSPSVAMGATIDVVRANNGDTVYYAPCWNGTRFSGANISYWNYSTNAGVNIVAGECP